MGQTISEHFGGGIIMIGVGVTLIVGVGITGFGSSRVIDGVGKGVGLIFCFSGSLHVSPPFLQGSSGLALFTALSGR
jgi:hypothetical protein